MKVRLPADLPEGGAPVNQNSRTLDRAVEAKRGPFSVARGAPPPAFASHKALDVHLNDVMTRVRADTERGRRKQ